MDNRVHVKEHPGKFAVGAFAWVAALCLAATAAAAPIPAQVTAGITSDISYASRGLIYGAVTEPVIQFQGVGGGTVHGSDPFNMGSFVISTPKTGDVTYNNTPFALLFDAPQFHKVVQDSPGTIPTQYDGFLSFHGVLKGTVFANGRSNVIATVNNIQPYGIDAMTADRVYKSGLPFPVSDVKFPRTIDLSTSAGGGEVHISAQAIPEPTSALVFLASAGLAGLYGRRRVTARAR